MQIRWSSRWAAVVISLLVLACAPKQTPPKLSLGTVQAQRHYEYGLSKLQQGKPEKAEKEFWKAIKLTPDEALLYQGVGRALQQQGKPELAVEALLEGARLNSSLPKLFYQLGDVYTELKRWPEAIKYSLFALEFKDFEQRAAALSNLALGLMGLDFWEPARYTLEAALMEDPDFVLARWQLVLALEELGEWAEAIRHSRKILRLGETRPHQISDLFLSQVNEQIALAYSKLGKPQVGESFRKRSQLLAPGRSISLE